MSIEIDATYRSGAIYPNQPLALPENTPLRVVVQPGIASTEGLSPEEIIARQPSSPKISSEEFRARIFKHAVSVG